MRILHRIVCLSLVMLVVSPLTSLHQERTMKKSQQMHTLFDWENPAVVGRNKEPAHCTYIPYSDIQTALKNEPSRSPFYKSLNGLWKFNWVKKPADRPVDFYKVDYDVSQWHDISVPGNWELQGFGVPIYTDTEYPFPSDPPRIPHDDNPVGSYKRTFTIPDSWFDNQVFLHLGSVKSAMYVWINGNEVGYSQGSKTPAEFNITRYLRQGDNSLASEVYRFSDGAYLEGQDYWKISGIERDVYLFSTPNVRIQDFFVLPDLDERYRNATLKVSVHIKNHLDKIIDNYHLHMDLLDENNRSILGSPIEKELKINEQDEVIVSFDPSIKNPKKWTAETPNLYTLVLSLLDESEE
ncbi:MAG: beta-galactosidase, partial [Candidatus Aminicenantes bacterium]|nr:beta-galactosidase [Candidatus Aminicenantes bacterium]